ncbi:hypothetical protein AtEden1_Chr3g0201611 [Arabidopsis thaliana]
MRLDPIHRLLPPNIYFPLEDRKGPRTAIKSFLHIPRVVKLPGGVRRSCLTLTFVVFSPRGSLKLPIPKVSRLRVISKILLLRVLISSTMLNRCPKHPRYHRRYLKPILSTLSRPHLLFLELQHP